MESCLCKIAHGLGVIQRPMTLGQAEEGRGAFGGGRGRHGPVRGFHVVVATVLVPRLQRAGLPFQEG